MCVEFAGILLVICVQDPGHLPHKSQQSESRLKAWAAPRWMFFTVQVEWKKIVGASRAGGGWSRCEKRGTAGGLPSRLMRRRLRAWRYRACGTCTSGCKSRSAYTPTPACSESASRHHRLIPRRDLQLEEKNLNIAAGRVACSWKRKTSI